MSDDPRIEAIEHDEPAHAYDRQEPNYKVVTIFSIVCVILFFATCYAVYVYYDMFREQQVYNLVLAPPSQELKSVRDREDRQLHTYGIDDRQKGTVRIPIERAMQLVIQDAKNNSPKYPTNAYEAKPPVLTSAAPAPAGPGGAQSPSGSIPGTTAGGYMNVSPPGGGQTHPAPAQPK
jgi:hypothetical protein